MKYRNPVILIFFFLVSITLYSQEKFLTITGKITDAKTHQSVASASLQLKSGGAGTASNLNGEFLFKIRGADADDTLIISCIGYKTIKKPVSPIENHHSIILEPAVTELATVTVNASTGLDILKRSLARIPQNYDTSDVRLTAFYRENIWIGDFELNFSEAILDIYKTFKSEQKLNDQLRIIKGRKKSINYGKEAQLYFWISGVSNGARGTLGNDMIKYRAAKSSPFNPSNFRYYNYKYIGTINEGSRNLIVLSVDPRKKARKALVHMKLFIDEESLAIIKYNIEVSEQGIREIERRDKGIGYRIMTKVVHANTEYHKFLISVLYNQYKDKWYLNRVTQHFEILVDSKRRNWEDRLWRADMDLMMTGIEKDNAVPILEGNIGGKEAPIHTLINGDYNDAFWEHYNILKPELADSLRINSYDTTKSTVQNDNTTENKITHSADENAISNVGDPQSIKRIYSNRQNGFTWADTLRGKLTPLRTCYDVRFYHLDVTIDINKRSLKGSNLIRFRVEQPFKKMQVDLYSNMKIDSILYLGKQLAYTREFNAVFIDFPAALSAGAENEIKIFYEGVPKVPDFKIPMDGGLLWDKDSLGNLWAQMVCQGSGASLWWPNKDHQSDEPDSMNIWITVPSEYNEISNGRLVAKRPQPGNQTRYEWKVSYPINNYNVSFGIGKYAHYQDRYITDDTLTIDYYVMPYNLDRAKQVFSQVKPMLKTFEKYFGKYPFPRDGFTLVESLYPMEHQSGVCIGKITAQSSGDASPLLWHESAHEWWGNSITCKDIADMWIHEAFATYAETLVIEDRFGKEAANVSMTDQVKAVVGKEPVTGVYDVNHIHYDIGDMYSKGSLMLHTFRNVLNNEKLWTTLLQDIQKHFRYQVLSANELVDFINQQTKSDYSYLFDQYLHYTELPKLEIKSEESGKNLLLKYRWVANVKNFRMPVKVTVTANQFDFLYPTTTWKTIMLKNISGSEFEVDDENFYIDYSQY